MKKHINIPIFIPHLGCRNCCVFCNQRSISGHTDFHPEDVDREISEALATVPEGIESEIAFFGGSFTGIDRELMIYLLDTAKKYTDSGRVSGIRLSTRPDYINKEILDILSGYKIAAVELGLQSMDDGVLIAAKRGHDAATAEKACREVKAYGFSLVGQMMIGLPGSDVGKEILTAEKICALGADAARIYPTVVFAETELYDMTKSGRYTPLTTEEAVTRTKETLAVFDRHGVPCIRVGLCASENLSDPAKVAGGANHSAIGELAMGELFYDRICEQTDRVPGEKKNRTLTVYVPTGCVSKAVGQNRRNKKRLCEKYGFSSVKVLEKNDMIGYNVLIRID